jgi:DUF2892 family protein
MQNENTSTERDRVRRYTEQETLERIDQRITESVRYYSTQPDAVIQQRVEELDREWDIERRLEATASSAIVATSILGFISSRKWFFLTAVVGGFLFQHAVKGWCPPLPVFRAIGARTRKEIDREKFALKALRGDFRDLPVRPEQPAGLAAQALGAATA